MFKIEAIGNLGGDAEIKNDNGRLYVQFSVADTRRFTKEDGSKKEVTNWISCFYRNADAEIVKYLKRGTRVFVRGNGDLRLFSSEKDRMMKAGCSINVQEIELVGGGSSDEVPRELALPTGQLVPVYKAYYIIKDSKQALPPQLFDRKGMPYTLDENGFVYPPSKPSQDDTEAAKADSAEQSQDTQEGSGDSDKPFV